MSLSLFMWIVAAGSAGAIGRHVIARSVWRMGVRGYPIGTVVANLAGAFAAGFVAGSVEQIEVTMIVALGFLGALTTFSTWMVEACELWSEQRPAAACFHVGGPLVMGVGLAVLGLWLGGGMIL